MVLGAGGEGPEQFRGAERHKGNRPCVVQIAGEAVHRQVEDRQNGDSVHNGDGRNADGHVPVDDRLLRWPGRILHDVGLALFHPQRQGRRPVRDQVQVEQLDGFQRDGKPHQHRTEDDQDLADVAGQQEVNELADIGIDDSSLFDRRNDAGEVVVRQDHVRRLLRDVGAGDPHRHTDVRPLERRRIVHAVSGHRDDMAPCLEGVDDLRFVRRGNTAADIHPVGLRGKLLIAHLIQLGSGQDQAACCQKPDLAGDRFRGIPVVSRHHDALESGAGGQLHRLDHFRPRRIDHPQQADKGEILFNLVAVAVFRDILQRAASHPQDPQCTGRHRTILLEDFPALVLGEGNRFAASEIGAAELQNNVRRPLDECGHRGVVESLGSETPMVALFVAVDRGHSFPFRIERDFSHARQSLLHLLAPEAGLGRSDRHRPFRRIADDPPVFGAGIILLLLQI